MHISRSTPWLPRLLLAAFLVALALLVFQPSEDHGANGIVSYLANALTRLGLAYDPTFQTIEFLANIALFMPLGLLVPAALRTTKRRTLLMTIATGFVLSALIELTQQLIPGRVSDPRDLLANTLGAALGALLHWIIFRANATTVPHEQTAPH